jgi:GntR family transcriptional regulator, carbon starvation induced regulator
MARQRQGRSLAEDVYEALRADVLLGRRLPGSRIQLRDLADEHGVSLSVVREAVTRLASEDLVVATPQRGFRVRSLSLEDLRDLTWVRIQIETLAVRQSIANGDVDWEADLVSAHHRLAGTPTQLEDGTPNVGWMAVHGAYHTALCAAAGSPTLERIRRQLFDASELYRYWSATLPADTPQTVRRHADDEHRDICEAALARDADRAVELMTAPLNATARQLEATAAAEANGDTALSNGDDGR